MKNILSAVFFVLNFLSIFCFHNQTKFVRIIEESRKKRWNDCDRAAASEIAANSFNVANSFIETILY